MKEAVNAGCGSGLDCLAVEQRRDDRGLEETEKGNIRKKEEVEGGRGGVGSIRLGQ